MKLIVPDYYPAFRCIAGACRHSCCIGWEIGVDEASMARYMALEGDMGRRLRAQIDVENACFRLGEGERCPFLNGDGLCEMIIECGEDSLCQICADHPRFRNEMSDRTEMGLGLCCEAAAELILRREEKMQLICLEDDGGAEAPDAAFLRFRDGLLDAVQDRSMPILQRVQRMEELCGISVEPDWADWAAFLMGLERLDPAWEGAVQRLNEPDAPVDGAWELPLEQLMAYLIFRHLSGALEDDDLQGRVAYCVVMWKLLRRMNRGDLEEICRMYSSEIEYSDENLDAALDKIDEILYG